MVFSWFMDLLVAGLLIATIIYCVRLNRNLQAIKDSRNELGTLIGQFADATDKAQESVEELKHNTKKITDNLQARLDKGTMLADDLAYMIEKATKLADQLEGGIASAKQRQTEKAPLGGIASVAANSPRPAATPMKSGPSLNVPTEPAKTAGTKDAKPQSQAEKELLEALKAIR